ncbi:MAG: hypothetical protein WC489_00050 [Patescibacteria group bacterium]
MKKDQVLFHSDYRKNQSQKDQTSEFIRFVGNQFKQLTQKNLGLPMKLYHL